MKTLSELPTTKFHAWSWEKTIFAALLGFLLTPQAFAAANQLNLFLWSDYIDPAVVQSFVEKNDCRVNLTQYEDAESMLDLVRAGNTEFDIILPPAQMVPRLRKANLLAPLRHENIPNLRHLAPKFANPPFDPGNQYTVGYLWGTVGIFLRPPAGKIVEPTWGVVFEPRQTIGPFTLIASSRELIGAALKFKGWSLNSIDASQLRQTGELLKKTKRRSLGLRDGVMGRNQVVAKTASAAIVFSGDGMRSAREIPATVYLVPKEGAPLWMDNLAVLAGAQHRDMAEKFINHLLDPEISARNANFLHYATPNQAARKFITPADLNNPGLYPAVEVLDRCEFIQELDAAAASYDSLWEQLKGK
ncbi:MAG: spermidine/putrescine ABC transporter substrate-binding protein [Verrucomicrobia bacterium]|nr:spermidine/putrescine ABC transporter substrate-binding protein [Verrucomicrobiota bacterium]